MTVAPACQSFILVFSHAMLIKRISLNLRGANHNTSIIHKQVHHWFLSAPFFLPFLFCLLVEHVTLLVLHLQAPKSGDSWAEEFLPVFSLSKPIFQRRSFYTTTWPGPALGSTWLGWPWLGSALLGLGMGCCIYIYNMEQTWMRSLMPLYLQYGTDLNEKSNAPVAPNLQMC